jgi:hypothetical protein
VLRLVLHTQPRSVRRRLLCRCLIFCARPPGYRRLGVALPQFILAANLYPNDSGQRKTAVIPSKTWKSWSAPTGRIALLFRTTRYAIFRIHLTCSFYGGLRSHYEHSHRSCATTRLFQGYCDCSAGGCHQRHVACSGGVRDATARDEWLRLERFCLATAKDSRRRQTDFDR